MKTSRTSRFTLRDTKCPESELHVRLNMRKYLLIIGLIVTIAGGGIYALSFWRYSPPQRCVVLAPPVLDSGHARLPVTTAQGEQLEPRLYLRDHTSYKEGDTVLICFPLMDNPYVLSGYSMVMHYIIDYPTVLALGLVLLAIGSMKQQVESGKGE